MSIKYQARVTRKWMKIGLIGLNRTKQNNKYKIKAKQNIDLITFNDKNRQYDTIVMASWQYSQVKQNIRVLNKS